MITRREFSKLGLGVAALSTGVNAFGDDNMDKSSRDSGIPATPKDWTGSRRVGLRVNGAYWGGSYEQLDILSGNLSFCMPLVYAISRGVTAKVVCSYNSQLWEENGANELAHGTDSGFGHGWRIQIGSLVPQTVGKSDGYTYINDSGAEYPLSPLKGRWVSLQGLYISYDPAEARLQFPDGTFWIMGCESAAGECDRGARYPTLIQDRNGNQVIVRYMQGLGSNKTDSSPRIAEITDARAVNSVSGRKTYSFIYNEGAIPHLLAINSHVGNPESWSFSYETQRLTSPFKASGESRLVQSLRGIRTAAGFDYNFTFNDSGEMQHAYMPYGARFRWEYETTSLTEQSRIRSVAQRGLMMSSNAKENVYNFRRLQKEGVPYTILTEPGGMATRSWIFNTDGLLSTFEERDGRSSKVLRLKTNRWKSTASGVPYIYVTTITLDSDTPSEKSSREEFDRDLFGNLTENRKYDYDNASQPLSVTRNTYVTDPAYIAHGIYNMLLTTTISNGEETIEQVRNQYDTKLLVDGPNLSEHDHQYDKSWTVRGNLTECISGGVYTRRQFDIAGTINSYEDGAGGKHTIQQLWTIPSLVMQPAPIAVPSGNNGEVDLDSIGRPVSMRIFNGTRSFISYEGNSITKIKDRKYKKSVYDDFHRLCAVEEGAIDDDKSISIVEYEYGAVPGAPLGGCLRASLPHAPGAKVEWVHYEYDALGRLAAKDMKWHGGKERFSYAGNSITVTNSSGGSKTVSHDAKWQLRKVTTPKDNAKGKDEINSLYQYDALGNLKLATLQAPEGTQEHSFKHDGGGRLLAGRRAESGREDMLYNADGTMTSRTDAKGQRSAYAYDSFKRLVSIKRFESNGRVKPDQCVSYYYDRNPFDAAFSRNAEGRLAVVQWGDTNTEPGLLTEMYSYTTSGRITQKRLRVNRGTGNADLDLDCEYNDEGRIVAISYPNGGPKLKYDYDAMGRQNQLTTATDVLIKNVSYSTAGHLTSFSQLIPETTEYLIQTREIDSQCRMNRRIVKSEHEILPLIDIEYNHYEDGKLESDIDHVSGESTRYEYDVSGRLKTASGLNRNWGLEYNYDGFGNLAMQKRRNKGRGKDFATTHDPATNRIMDDQVEYDANGNMVRIGDMRLAFDIENRLVELKHSEKGVEKYAYDPRNQRIWKKQPNGIEEFSLYSADGKLMAIYKVAENKNGILEFTLSNYSIYFANQLVFSRGRAVVLNRQRSVEAERGRTEIAKLRYLPFGEEESTTAGNRVKFGTYLRDDTSGLDYAKARYYSSELGRFVSPDPYEGSIKIDKPDTWNRYAYCGNDPVNRIDPDGRDYCQWVGTNCVNYICPVNGSGLPYPLTACFGPSGPLFEVPNVYRVEVVYVEHPAVGTASYGEQVFAEVPNQIKLFSLVTAFGAAFCLWNIVLDPIPWPLDDVLQDAGAQVINWLLNP